MMPATQTPLPISIQGMNQRRKERVRAFLGRLQHLSSLEGESPELLARDSFDILMRYDQHVPVKALDILRSFAGVPGEALEDRTQEVLTETLTLFLKEAWCRETANPRKQQGWKPETPWIGQEVISAILLNEVFGGTLESVQTEDNTVCVWNLLETKVAVNPACRGPLPPHGKRRRPVERRTLEKNEEFKRAFLLLKKRFLQSVEIWGLAAASLALKQGWTPPEENWNEVG